ncbi:major facilitator superfamily domain-containing protein [Entophlyctis helioformis]|nr:major facilitator superfamily domain-containing protein [Entophlyctis helioformis]
MDLIARHYGEVKFERSESWLNREKYLALFPPVAFNRYMLFPAALLIQLSCGSLYAWSGYNLPLEAYIYGLNKNVDRNIASNIFYVAVGVFGLSSALLGPWLERRGPFLGCLVGALLFYIGNLLSGLGVYYKIIELVFIGYGVIGGMGLGIAYISPVSPLQKWFPEARGIAAGVAVCGFGGGSIIAPYTQKALIGANYAKTGEVGLVGVPLTFVILGSIYFVAMSLSAVVLRMPPPGYHVKGITIDTIKGAEGFHQKSNVASAQADWIPSDDGTSTKVDHNAVVDVQSSAAPAVVSPGKNVTGLLIISKIQTICQNQFGRDPDTAALINSLLGGANLLGRIVLPLTSDLLPFLSGGVAGRKSVFMFSLIVQAILLGFIPTTIDQQLFPVFLVCAFGIAFCYGGGFGIIPAFLADQFGAKNVGATHGIILLAWSTGAVVGGLIFTAVLKQQQALYAPSTREIYNLNFKWILGLIIIGFVISIFIDTNLRDRRMPYVEGEVLRIRFVNGRMIRFFKTGREKEWQSYLASLNL